jgi:hypothetical protein
MKHTKEDRGFMKKVYFVDKADNPKFGFYSVHNHDGVIAQLDSEKNAKRIADCLNACNGMEVPFETHVRTAQQRDKLLEAAKDYILDAVECSEPNGSSKTYLESVIKEIDSVQI